MAICCTFSQHFFRCCRGDDHESGFLCNTRGKACGLSVTMAEQVQKY